MDEKSLNGKKLFCDSITLVILRGDHLKITIPTSMNSLCYFMSVHITISEYVKVTVNAAQFSLKKKP